MRLAEGESGAESSSTPLNYERTIVSSGSLGADSSALRGEIIEKSEMDDVFGQERNKAARFTKKNERNTTNVSHFCRWLPKLCQNVGVVLCRHGLAESAAGNIHDRPTGITKNRRTPAEDFFITTAVDLVIVGLMGWPYRQKVGQLQPSRTCRKVTSEK